MPVVCGTVTLTVIRLEDGRSTTGHGGVLVSGHTVGGPHTDRPGWIMIHKSTMGGAKAQYLIVCHALI